MGDLNDTEREIYRRHGAFLDSISSTPMTKSYKMLVLQAMLVESTLPGTISLSALTQRFIKIAEQNPQLRSDVGAPLDDAGAVQHNLVANPIAAWVGGKGTSGDSFFTFDGDAFATSFSVEPDLLAPFVALASEIVEWRVAQYLDREPRQLRTETPTVDATRESSEIGEESDEDPELWREFKREEIPPYFGASFNPGSWNSGIVISGQEMILLVTLTKGDLAAGNEYDDRFIDPQTFHWQSQTQTTQRSKRGRIISGVDPGYRIHLFVRPSKLRGSKAAPFTYCGAVNFTDWEGEKPISVTWKLQRPVPQHLWRPLGLK